MAYVCNSPLNPVIHSVVGSRAPTPVPTVPIPSDRDRAEPLGVPLLGLSTPSDSPTALWPIWTPSVLLPNYTMVIPLRVIRTPTGRESNVQSLRAAPPYDTFFSAGHWPCPPKSERVSPHTSAPSSRRSRSSLAKAASILPTRTLSFSSVIQPRPTTPYCLRGARLAFGRTNQSVFTCHYSCALGSCKPAIRLIPAI